MLGNYFTSPDWKPTHKPKINLIRQFVIHLFIYFDVFKFGFSMTNYAFKSVFKFKIDKIF